MNLRKFLTNRSLSMSLSRLEDLLVKLKNGHQKTRQVFCQLTSEEWQVPLYNEPEWSAYNLLAHFVSAEEQLLRLSQNVVENGPGAPEGFDIDQFNAQEQARNQGRSVGELLVALDQARQRTIDWARNLTEEQLDKIGRHPALGKVSVEAMLTAMYGHQILHLRDLGRHQRAAKTA
jgi:hypothetical protein